MCGIAGGIVNSRSLMTRATLERMLHAIEHRGPDGHGTCEFAAASGHRVLLGHRRLAIIDPVGGKQPMLDNEAQLALTFNGEIYNFRELREELKVCGYRFERDSDTEVLLRAYQQWGEKCVEKLRGMFAFAIWDGRNQKLFMARDRFGEKPLFLLEDAEGVHFASEIKALLQLPRAKPDVNLTAVWDFLSYRYVPGPRTLFRGIRKLPPATCLTWENGKLTERRHDTREGQAGEQDVSARGSCGGGWISQGSVPAVELHGIESEDRHAIVRGSIVHDPLRSRRGHRAERDTECDGWSQEAQWGPQVHAA